MNNLYLDAIGKKVKEKFGLENWGILWKETTRNITCKGGRNIFRPLLAARLLLKKSVLIPLAKSYWCH